MFSSIEWTFTQISAIRHELKIVYGESKLDYDELELLEEARLLADSTKKHEKLDKNILICECMCISVGDIREFFKGNEINLSDLSSGLNLGSGCSSCLKSFEQWKDKI